MQKRRPVMLAILDGWGWREDPADNAVPVRSVGIVEKAGEVSVDFHVGRLGDTAPPAHKH